MRNLIAFLILSCNLSCVADWEISWAKQDKAEYSLTYSRVGSNISTTVQLGNNSRYIFKNPEINTKYSFRIIASLGEKTSISNEIIFGQLGSVKPIKLDKPQPKIKIID